MARTFTKNAANYCSLGIGSIGPLLSGVGKFSVGAWVRLTSVTAGADDNTLITVIDNAASVGMVLSIDGSIANNPKIRAAARSVSTDTKRTKSGNTTIPLGVDVHIGATYDIAGQTLSVYFNGIPDGSGAAVFANGVWTFGTPTSPDTLSGYLAPPATASQLDGVLSEIALWTTGGLTDPEFARLGAGHSALKVRRDRLVWYMQLKGTVSPEQSVIGGIVATITGSLPAASHPYVKTWSSLQGGIG
jgi:hypothetical protein